MPHVHGSITGFPLMRHEIRSACIRVPELSRYSDRKTKLNFIDAVPVTYVPATIVTRTRMRNTSCVVCHGVFATHLPARCTCRLQSC